MVTYPALDMATDASLFFRDFGGADGGGRDSAANSVGSIFDRLFRRFKTGSASTSGTAGACSGVVS